MTTTYSPTQTASILATTVDPTSLSLPATTDFTGGGGGFVGGLNGAALYRFQIPSIYTYFVSTLTFTTTASIVSPPNTYYALLAKSPDAISTLVYGSLALSLIPSAYYPTGTAESYELDRVTLTASGTLTFDFDLAYVTEIMSKSGDYSHPWNGSLLFWICGAQGDGSTLSTTATLTAYDTITYTNRDTGSRGLEDSRWTRCPVSGLKIPRGKMVMDGYRNILVAPDSYDPPEPEAFEWTDREDPNEDA